MEREKSLHRDCHSSHEVSKNNFASKENQSKRFSTIRTSREFGEIGNTRHQPTDHTSIWASSRRHRGPWIVAHSTPLSSSFSRRATKERKKKKKKRIGFFLDLNQYELRRLFAWTNPELNRGPHPDLEGATAKTVSMLRNKTGGITGRLAGCIIPLDHMP